jgi:hypothetical protein
MKATRAKTHRASDGRALSLSPFMKKNIHTMKTNTQMAARKTWSFSWIWSPTALFILLAVLAILAVLHARRHELFRGAVARASVARAVQPPPKRVCDKKTGKCK